MDKKQYVSWGNYIEIETVDGRIFKDALLYPDEFEENEHVLEFKNGIKINIKTNNLKRLYCKVNNMESILQ